MLQYLLKYHGKLEKALLEHLEIVLVVLVISVLLAAVLTILMMRYHRMAKTLIHLFEMVYCIPSLALFAIMIPLTGLGKTTAIMVLVLYNQYILLRNFYDGLNQVDPAVVEAAVGMGMSDWQLLFRVRLPLAGKAIFAGIHLAVVSTIGIATVAASINAGGIGSILFDGLRTVNTVKIVWGSALAAGLAILMNWILGMVEKRLDYAKRQPVHRHSDREEADRAL